MTTELVGRDGALAEVERLLGDAREGRGRLVLLTGEAGIGKTRLAEELVRRAAGFTAHWTWCRVDQTMGSLRSWSTVLRALTQTVPAVGELAERSDVLRSLVSGTSPDDVHPEAVRAALAADVGQALSLAGTTPRLVVMDDLHDAEASTLRLLLDVSAQLRTLPVLLVATARDTGWSGREQLYAELLHQAHRVPLGPLSEGEVQQLAPGSDERLYARTGGNPLLVTELARSHEAVPTSLLGLVHARLDALDPTTQDVLRAAAVLGPRFRIDVLSEVTDVPLDQLSPHLPPELVTSLTPGEARFTHELLRDAVYEGLGHGSRQRWHSRAGEVLDQLMTRGRMVAPAEVATHLLEAGPDQAAHAAQRCLDAAAQAEAMQAFEDAVRWHDQALELLTGSPDRAEALVRRARARRGCGDVTGARDDLLEAGSLAQQANRPDLLAVAALALGTGPGGFEVDQEDAAQLDLLEQALAALPEDDLARRAAILARLSVARARLEPAPVLRDLATRAVELGRASGDPVALGVALAALCDAIAGPDHVQDRLDHATEIVQLARQVRDGDLELLGRRLRVVALMELGNREECEREQRAYEIRADEVRHPTYLWYPPLWRATWAAAEGDYDRARELLEESRRLGGGGGNAEMLYFVASWTVATWIGDVDRLRPLFQGLELNAFPDLWAGITRALMAAQVGDLDKARSTLDLVADRLDELPFDSEWMCSLAQAAEVVERLGGHPAGATVYALLEPYASVFCVEGIGASLRGPGHVFLGWCAPDPVTRKHHMEQAAQLLRACGAIGRFADLDDAAVAPAPARDRSAVLRREGDVWAFAWNGRETRVKDSKGLRDLCALLASPGKEVSALDLYGEQAPLEHDTGEVLDATARQAYKQRLAELEAEPSLSEAEALERELLLEQLGAAYGLGGRVRRTGSSAEKARTAVTARVRDTLKRLAAIDPDLGRHLSHSVRTGTFCSYSPETPVDWLLTP